jgi:hypothetical protein
MHRVANIRMPKIGSMMRSASNPEEMESDA